MRKETRTKITQEELKEIFGDNYDFFQKELVTNCFCSNCPPPHFSVITNYEIFLNDLNDVVLKGFCTNCSSPIGRYLETGEVPKSQLAIKKILKSSLTLSNTYLERVTS